MSDTENRIKFTYHFKFPDEKDQKANEVLAPLSYNFALDADSLAFLALEKENPNPDEWSKLDYKKCSNCPLKSSEHSHCPVAKNLSNLVYFFKDTVSHKKSRIFVETPERAYAVDATVQEGLFSIFGVVMATSGCPHLDFFRPLARFHLPFASPDETMFRTVSAFLLRRYLENAVEKKNLPMDLSGLSDIYKEVSTLNLHFIDRIRSVVKKDAELNAVVILNCFAMKFEAEVTSHMESLHSLFGIKKSS